MTTIEQPPQARPRKAVVKERILLQWLGLTVGGALLLLTAALAVLVIALPAAVGGQALTVLTNSMAPKYPPGTLIVIRPVEAADIRIGDVITYQIESGKAAVVTHRVIQKTTNTESKELDFVTQGDNNAVPDDDVVREVQVRGELWYALPWLGYVNTALGGDARAFLVPIIAGLLFAYGGWTVVSTIRGRRRAAAGRGRRSAS